MSSTRSGRSGNHVLAEALAAAGLSPREFMHALNGRLRAVGEPNLDLTAANKWLTGMRPRSAAVRRVAATLLTDATAHAYEASDLWPAAWPTDPLPSPRATDDLDGGRTLPDVLASATAFTIMSTQDIACVRSATPAEEFAATWDAIHQRPGTAGGTPPGTDRVLPPLMDLLEVHLAELRRLDDLTGGGALSQRWVRNALAGVLDLLRNSSYTPLIGRRLLATAAGLAQLAGWMAADAGLVGAAQRYQFLGIRLATAAEDQAAVANLCGMMAYQHAADRHGAQAVRIAELAVEQSRRQLPSVRARAFGRLANAFAAAGDLDGYRAASDGCRSLLAQRRPDDPEHLYYFTDTQADAEAGLALVDLAEAHHRTSKHLLAEAIGLLTPLVEHGAAQGYRRSAVLHGGHLARAHLLAHEPELAAATLVGVARYLPDVQSIRCRTLIAALRRQIGSRARTSQATDDLAVLDRALSTT